MRQMASAYVAMLSTDPQLVGGNTPGLVTTNLILLRILHPGAIVARAGLCRFTGPSPEAWSWPAAAAELR